MPGVRTHLEGLWTDQKAVFNPEKPKSQAYSFDRSRIQVYISSLRFGETSRHFFSFATFRKAIL